MKKLFLLTCMVLTALVTMAQTKKVAILEVVDKEGKLSYSQKLMLRSNMGKAVTNTAGYEAYDRTDIDAIMSEQDFQRTGMVSNKEIKQLGEMTGVAYILVTEGALTSDGKIFVTVKLLNVESARVEIVDNTIMGTSGSEMQKGCESLAHTLFGKPASSGNAKASSTKSVGSGYVVRVSSKEYTCDGKSMNKREYEYFLHNTCTNAYAQFKSGRKLVSGGWASLVLGAAFIGSGATMMALEVSATTYSGGEYYSYSSDGGILYPIGATFVALGSAGVAASVPLLAVGYVKQKKSVNTYNAQCASNKLSFNLTAGQNGLGIAMNF